MAGAALPFTYETRTTARTRRLRLTVYPGGRIVLSCPRSISRRAADRFVRAHEAWVVREAARMKDVVVPKKRMHGTRREYLARKEEARRRVTARIVYYASRYGFRYGRIAIKNMSSRWGSCSAKGNLNFHYKVVDLPPELVDYLVVHELCHLREMNHGPVFWHLVAREIPAWQDCRRRLRAVL